MGGRGSSSSKGGGGGLKTVHTNGGSFGGDTQNFSNGLGFPNYKTGAEALGPQGKPMSMSFAATGANPHYDRSGTYSEFNDNCQRCVVANEARRRGYDVTAQPTYKGDTMPQPEKWNKAFENPNPIQMKSRTQVETTMISYGNGARAVMTFNWNNGYSGHAISVEFNQGKITYLDPQAGSKYIPTELYNSIEKGTITLTRVNNLKFSDDVKYAVTKDKW